jgi:hypothetical protein
MYYCDFFFIFIVQEGVSFACFVSFFPVEILQGLVSGNLGGILGQAISSPVEQEVTAGPVSLPRRAETFGGFDSHQMNASKGKRSPLSHRTKHGLSPGSSISFKVSF